MKSFIFPNLKIFKHIRSKDEIYLGSNLISTVNLPLCSDSYDLIGQTLNWRTNSSAHRPFCQNLFREHTPWKFFEIHSFKFFKFSAIFHRQDFVVLFVCAVFFCGNFRIFFLFLLFYHTCCTSRSQPFVTVDASTTYRWNYCTCILLWYRHTTKTNPR